jgi:hypothetical protein
MLQEMSQEEFDQLLQKYLNNKCSEEEAQLMSQWYEGMKPNDNPPGDHLTHIESELWNKINHKIDFESSSPKELPSKKTGFNYFFKVGIAASLLLALTSTYFFIVTRERSFSDSEYAYEKSELVTLKNQDSKVVKPVRLKDGSLIILQPKSEISFDQSFSSRIREVTLKGEAFFEIAKDSNHPFLVHSFGLITKVLGTSFNIRAKPGDRTIVVDVKTGRVAVYKENKGLSDTEYHLTPNQQVVYDLKSKKILQQLQENPQIIISEEEINEMKFEDARVPVVFAAIEKAYGIDLVYNESIFATCSITTKMTNEGLKERLEIICKAVGASYKIDGTKILLDGKGCELNEPN